jgi:uncharacterized membrane protein
METEILRLIIRTTTIRDQVKSTLFLQIIEVQTTINLLIILTTIILVQAIIIQIILNLQITQTIQHLREVHQEVLILLHQVAHLHAQAAHRVAVDPQVVEVVRAEVLQAHQAHRVVAVTDNH